MHNPLRNPIITEDMENIYKRDYAWEELRGSAFFVSGAYGMLASYLVLYLCWLNEEHELDIKIFANGRSPEKMEARFGALCSRA